MDCLLSYVEGKRDWTTAKDVFERRNGDSKDYDDHKRLNYAILLANHSDIGEVEEQLVQIDDLEAWIQCDLALLWLQVNNREAAVELIEQTVAQGGNAQRSLMNRFNALIERGYTPEHARYIEPYNNKDRYTDLAELLYEAMPESDEAHRILVYALAANRHWRSVIRAMEDRTIGLRTASSDWFTSLLALAGAYSATGNPQSADRVLEQLSEIAKRSSRKPPDAFGDRADNIPLRKPLEMYWEKFR